MSSRGDLFDSVADQYDRGRPSYPDVLVNEVLARAAVPPSGRILELGCGTGKATVPFAARGYRMVCLEPGPRLAALTAAKFESDPNVRIEVARFEDWDGADPSFDLVFAAQAFHWIDREVRVKKAARCLRPGGWLALFWNTPQPGESDVDRALLDTYVSNAPSLFAPENAWSARARGPAPEEELSESVLFGPVVSRAFEWSADYSADEYADLVGTQSDHLALPDAERGDLFDAVRRTIRAHGDVLRVRFSTRLFMAQRRPA